jgi:hypothetical protein
VHLDGQNIINTDMPSKARHYHNLASRYKVWGQRQHLIRVVTFHDHGPRVHDTRNRPTKSCFFAILTATTTCLNWVGRQVLPRKGQDSKTCPAKARRDKQNNIENMAFPGIYH